ncbi:hypothetical protein ACO9S2_00530 [Nitrospira sp. NS4]|uniref:hypothetical protein n=1 Tax=Nitrospira sp. NS4 TaxID=3414498 RepID=UPI003C30C329
MNRRALELTGQPDLRDTGSASESVPAHTLRMMIQEMLGHPTGGGMSELFELKRVICDAGRKIFFRGFRLTDRQADEGARIVIILEEVGLPQP